MATGGKVGEIEGSGTTRVEGKKWAGTYVEKERGTFRFEVE